MNLSARQLGAASLKRQLNRERRHTNIT
jgi:hypothetical protein